MLTSLQAISEITVSTLATTNEIAYFTDSQNVFLSYAMLSLLKVGTAGSLVTLI
jgi:hypothetical protein